MDWTVHPNTPIWRLPRPLRYPALLLRNIPGLLHLMPRPSPANPNPDPPGPGYVYEADGLATVYLSPFLNDAAIPRAEIGDLSLVHMDLNASAPTRVALEYSYPRLVPGGAIVFDDYGWNPSSYEQRDVIDEFCGPLPENLLLLPSGQAILIKLPAA